MQSLSSSQVLLPLLFIVAGFLTGLFVEKVILHRLERFALLTRWRADNVLFPAFRGIPLFWGAALGIYVAMRVSTADPEFISRLEILLRIAIVWSLTIVAARMSAGLVSTYSSRNESFLPATSIIPNLIQVLIYLVGLLVILNELDVSIAPLLTALGVGGLAVALALQDTLANVFAGLYLLAARQVRPGDYIRLDSGEEGYITDVTWRSTSVRTISSNLIIIPNAKLASATVTNYHLPEREMLVRIPIGVAYESDLEHVERVTLEVVQETLREVSGRPDPQRPLLHFQGFGEFSLNFVVYLRVREYFEQYRVRHLFIKKLLVRYRAEGIKIPFPIKEFQMQVSTEGPGTKGPIQPADAAASAVESDLPGAQEERG